MMDSYPEAAPWNSDGQQQAQRRACGKADNPDRGASEDGQESGGQEQLKPKLNKKNLKDRIPFHKGLPN